ncbi:MAG TPA: alpha/beta fold hydrolase [Candidatus Methylacidiphilales bacterium]|nr:alpha/beta fold hydrolase [Candidatus Methylacidiphilales bacterium]
MNAPATSASRSAPSRHPLRRVLRWFLLSLVIVCAIIYAYLCGTLYSMQNSLLYPREILSPGTADTLAAKVGLAAWDPSTAGFGAPRQGYVRSDFTHPAPRGTIILFHGNGGVAFGRIAYVDAFTPRGFRTFLYEYPGYGGRPGVPGEAAIVPEARAFIRELGQAGYGPLYVWGESLGAGVAASVCADPSLPVQGLVLLTPWDTLANVAQSHYPWFPVRFLLIDRYDSVANLQHFGHPICVIRSSEDEIIPPPLSINLYQHLPEPKHPIVQDGYGHNDWPRDPQLAWWDEALDFIAPKK